MSNAPAHSGAKAGLQLGAVSTIQEGHHGTLEEVSAFTGSSFPFSLPLSLQGPCGLLPLAFLMAPLPTP